MIVKINNQLWNDIVQRLNKNMHDIFFEPRYFEIFQSSGYGEAEAYLNNINNNFFFIPYLKNKINENFTNKETFYDIQSPYGYSGFLTNSKSTIFIDNSIRNFIDLCKNENVICSFIRSNPLSQKLKPIYVLNKHFKIEMNRKIIVLNLKQSIKDIWNKEFNSNCRNMVRKSLDKYSYKISNSKNSYKLLIKFYLQNMKDIKADKFYFFNKNFFDKFYINLNKDFFIVEAINKNNETISSILVLYSRNYAHYMFSSRNKQFSDNSVINSLLFMAIKELKKRKISILNLGGGSTNSYNDNLFKFKSNFSKNNIDYTIATKIFLPDRYTDICNNWKKKYHNLEKKHSNKILKYQFYE